MTTVLFVHGTGVRQPAYDLTFEKVARGIAGIRGRFAVERSYWGGEHGSSLGAGGVSIPGQDSGRAITDEVDDEALWDLLDRDPLVELRMAATAERRMAELPPNAVPQARRLAIAAGELAADRQLEKILADANLNGSFADAVDAVLASEAFATADVVPPPVLARAIIAETLVRAERDLGGQLPIDGRTRSALVDGIADRLGDAERSLKSKALDFVLRSGLTKPLERRRAVLTSASAPASGDVLKYVARGQGIRDFVGRAVRAVADPPVILLAHSLGGIASVDLLVSAALPPVELLVTVGSQAPLLYELNALPSLGFGRPLPDHVPAWANIYDERDLLGFAGSRVFPGRVTDHVIDNRIGFPRSHSAYFGNRDFYALLDKVLP
ncbi:hypothetical protein AB5J62_17960 [Amycolatopsis sp. cg5]|uniref:hypothetical protein n=1 Tax=Amycolatopsis sp. cg5 TaxID=3238802 RepID=UPI0035234F26